MLGGKSAVNAEHGIAYSCAGLLMHVYLHVGSLP